MHYVPVLKRLAARVVVNNELDRTELPRELHEYLNLLDLPRCYVGQYPLEQPVDQVWPLSSDLFLTKPVGLPRRLQLHSWRHQHVIQSWTVVGDLVSAGEIPEAAPLAELTHVLPVPGTTLFCVCVGGTTLRVRDYREEQERRNNLFDDDAEPQQQRTNLSLSVRADDGEVVSLDASHTVPGYVFACQRFGCVTGWLVSYLARRRCWYGRLAVSVQQPDMRIAGVAVLREPHTLAIASEDPELLIVQHKRRETMATLRPSEYNNIDVEFLDVLEDATGYPYALGAMLPGNAARPRLGVTAAATETRVRSASSPLSCCLPRRRASAAPSTSQHRYSLVAMHHLDTSVVVWDWSHGYAVAVLPPEPTSEVVAIAASASTHSHLYLLTVDGSLQLWDALSASAPIWTDHRFRRLCTVVSRISLYQDRRGISAHLLLTTPQFLARFE